MKCHPLERVAFNIFYCIFFIRRALVNKTTLNSYSRAMVIHQLSVCRQIESVLPETPLETSCCSSSKRIGYNSINCMWGGHALIRSLTFKLGYQIWSSWETFLSLGIQRRSVDPSRDHSITVSLEVLLNRVCCHTCCFLDSQIKLVISLIHGMKQFQSPQYFSHEGGEYDPRHTRGIWLPSAFPTLANFN